MRVIFYIIVSVLILVARQQAFANSWQGCVRGYVYDQIELVVPYQEKLNAAVEGVVEKYRPILNPTAMEQKNMSEEVLLFAQDMLRVYAEFYAYFAENYLPDFEEVFGEYNDCLLDSTNFKQFEKWMKKGETDKVMINVLGKEKYESFKKRLLGKKPNQQFDRFKLLDPAMELRGFGLEVTSPERLLNQLDPEFFVGDQF